MSTKTPSVAHFLAFQTKQLVDLSQVSSRCEVERFHCTKCCNWLRGDRGVVRLYSKKRNLGYYSRRKGGKKKLWLVTTCERCQTRRKERIVQVETRCSTTQKKLFKSSFPAHCKERKNDGLDPTVGTCNREEQNQAKSLSDSFLFETRWNPKE